MTPPKYKLYSTRFYLRKGQWRKNCADCCHPKLLSLLKDFKYNYPDATLEIGGDFT